MEVEVTGLSAEAAAQFDATAKALSKGRKKRAMPAGYPDAAAIGAYAQIGRLPKAHAAGPACLVATIPAACCLTLASASARAPGAAARRAHPECAGEFVMVVDIARGRADPAHPLHAYLSSLPRAPQYAASFPRALRTRSAARGAWLGGTALGRAVAAPPEDGGLPDALHARRRVLVLDVGGEEAERGHAVGKDLEHDEQIGVREALRGRGGLLVEVVQHAHAREVEHALRDLGDRSLARPRIVAAHRPGLHERTQGLEGLLLEQLLW